jgi:hypothetical protein
MTGANNCSKNWVAICLEIKCCQVFVVFCHFVSYLLFNSITLNDVLSSPCLYFSLCVLSTI